ncbi:glycoside hydrolase family 99-like domain-containing protein [Gillisia sp. CAL575]|uniref:glycosyltransferase WbsX family protein n=1 Tax=Gillisia sp. CAL575 TaxID=985255 RepID=UPI0003A039FB|nr:glycoside hydrolase family 99-like domain-containing protein [Gillisia sp. CAL575]
MSGNIKFLAYYLPQFHPIPENDEWWGKGFTEWTNVAKAKPLFNGHYQPKLPADLGFYDLRIPQVQIDQANLAREHGIDGFIYYQYWFGDGKMLLEKPAEAMLKNDKIDLPFCFCWANETWKGIWHGLDSSKVLIEQKYFGNEDYIRYFEYLLPFFRDDRYIKIDNKPMFHIYKIQDIPDLLEFFRIFNKLSIENGFAGIYFVSSVVSHSNVSLDYNEIEGQVGLDIFQKLRYEQDFLFSNGTLKRIENRVKRILRSKNSTNVQVKPIICDYKVGTARLEVKIPHSKYIPCVFPNWDNSARSGKKSLIFKNSNPETWKRHLTNNVVELLDNPENPPFIFIKSWNEWAEGNYLEPDVRFGYGWLEAVKKVKENLEQLIKTQKCI